MRTWRKEIMEEMEQRGEDWNDVVGCTFTDDQLDKSAEDEDGSGDLEWRNPSYTWTKNRVYFVTAEECSRWITSVPRHPCECEPEEH